VAHGGFERLPQNNDFLMHGIPGWRLSVFLHRFLVAMNAVLPILTKCQLTGPGTQDLSKTGRFGQVNGTVHHPITKATVTNNRGKTPHHEKRMRRIC
jgi:hypothetical protein